jgi:hypothetical protein
VQKGDETAVVPSALQHRFTYKLYASENDQANDNPLVAYTEKTSKLVGKRMTLSYVPATQADADTIASYLPKPHADGSPIQASELPSSLPAYLIRLKAQINLDGQVVAQSTQTVQMGTDLHSTGGFTQLYDTSQWDLTSEESNVAGQATAIGISAGGVSIAQIAQLKDRLTTLQSQLQSGNTATLAGLSGEQISGDLLTATIWSWFAAAESHNRISQNQAGIIENPSLSYGLFHAIANPVSSWGVVRKVTFPGVNMDIGHQRNITWAKDNDEKNWIAYNRLRGQYMSALEHAIPERFFNDSTQCNLPGATAPSPSLRPCPQGISATKALALAAQAGQKIFTITREGYANNPSILSTNLSAHSQSTKDRIQQALDVGYEVTIHEAPIVQDGWVGAGFTVIDPSTGAGGYLIDSGGNGGWLLVVLAIALLVIAAYFATTLFLTGVIGAFGVFLGIAGPLLSFIQLLKGLGEINSNEQLNRLAAFTGLKAFSSILLSTVTMVFYSVNITVGFLSQLLPFSLLNFSIFFIGGWFF